MRKKCRYNSFLFLRKRWPGLLFGLVIVLFFSCGEQTSKESATDTVAQIYYCPMHLDVQQDHPGICPKPECNGMALLPKMPEAMLDAVLRPVSSNVLSKINISNPVYKSFSVFTQASGYIDYDNYAKWDVSSRYSGRIEKLYVKYNYQPVKKGDILFEVYSPELVTDQNNLLYLLTNSPGDTSLIAAARQKLKLLQLTDEQIKRIETSGKAMHSLAVYSKYDGHIHEMLDSKMESGNMNNYQNSGIISVKEGMYIERGQVLFNIVNLQRIVVMLTIKSDDIGKVKLRQSVSFYVNNDSSTVSNGTIDFIEPMFSNNSKTLMARVNVDNKKGLLKVGSLVNAKIIGDSLETLWVPASAVVDLGKNKIVWVSKDGYFKAQKVETGIRTNGMIEIADGLTEADKIATEAHFLSDSESFIKISSDE